MKPLKAHQQERVPATSPIEGVPGARTVLADKVRFAAPRGAPLSAPRRSGRSSYAMGGSGGNTYTV